ncbi:MAG: O-antigen ligase family protein, partial [Campylobacterales bacterium]|nr:O-antigen ligase family protein [Campylobacterales bacterium]
IEKLYYEQEYCTSWGTRAGAIVIAKEIVVQEPLFGVGLIDHTDKLKEIIRQKYPQMECFSWFGHFHNQYAEVVTSLGLVGLILFLSIFYFLLKMPLQSQEFKSIKVILVSVYLVGFIGEPFIIKQFTLVLFVLFFALLHGQYRIERS